MNYRIQFLAEEGDAGIASTLEHSRFPIFLHALAAARSEVMSWAGTNPDRVVVNIFDEGDRLTSRLQLVVPQMISLPAGVPD